MSRATDEESRACPGRLRRSPPTQPSSVRVHGARVLQLPEMRRLSGGGRRGKQATDEAEQLNVLGPMLNNYRSDDVREPS